MERSRIRQLARKIKDDILEPVILFPLSAALFFATFFVLAFFQFGLVLVSCLFTLYLLQSGKVAWVPPEFWSLSWTLLAVTLPIAGFFFLFMRFAWKKAKERHPRLSAPHR